MIKRRLQTMQAAQTPQTEQFFFVFFSYNCDFTYDYFLVTLELFTILGQQPNLQFNRNAWCTVCVKWKLTGQFPSDQQTGLEVSSVFFSFTKHRRYITNWVTVACHSPEFSYFQNISNVRPHSYKYRKCNPIIVHLVVKMRPHPATSTLM